jgi:hypothetical protein
MNFLLQLELIISAIRRFRTLIVAVALLCVFGYMHFDNKNKREQLVAQHEQHVLQTQKQHEAELAAALQASGHYQQQLEQLSNEHAMQVVSIVQQTPQVAKKFIDTFGTTDASLWGEFGRRYDIKIAH